MAPLFAAESRAALVKGVSTLVDQRFEIRLRPSYRRIVGCQTVGSMADKKQREARRAQQALEIEEIQEALRRSIAESQRLIDEAAQITRRHRIEIEEDEGEDAAG